MQRKSIFIHLFGVCKDYAAVCEYNRNNSQKLNESLFTTVDNIKLKLPVCYASYCFILSLRMISES